MLDIDIRTALDKILMRDLAHGAVIWHEMGFLDRRRQVDVAVIDDELRGYEIKSDSDTLRRLPSQAKDYGRVFDRMTLVVTEGHLDAALAFLPSWWGVIVARQDGDEVSIDHVWNSERNVDIDPVALAQCLWRVEAIEEIKARDITNNRTKRSTSRLRKRTATNMLGRSLELDELRRIVRERLKARPEPKMERKVDSRILASRRLDMSPL